MEAKQLSESVIARLMGFHEISPPSDPIRRKHRVLSEDYLRKSDSICLIEKNSYRKRRLSKVNSEIFNSVEVQGREKLHRNSINSRQRRETNLKVEICDSSRKFSDIVILRPIFGKSKSEMMLDFFTARKANNLLWEKWNMRKSTKQFAVARPSKASRFEKGNHDKKGSENPKISSGAHSFTDLEYIKATNETTETRDVPRKSSEKNQGFEISAENPYIFSENSEEEHFEQTAFPLDSNDELSHIYDDALIGQESSVYSSCPKIDPECHMSLGENYSPSPNSVLDPLFSQEILLNSDSFTSIGADPNGLQIQLQLLKSESEEMSSKEHEMVVSSDEESGDESVNCYNETNRLLRLIRPEECRDFSYIVEVLDEASLFGNSTKLESKLRYSLDAPLNPSLFEMLEKKYEKQSSWDKSDRRLLFDRINLGLKDILYSYTELFAENKLLGKYFKFSQSREVIEDELWRLLLSQENGVSRTVSEKALGTETKWLHLRDDIEFIVCEIEDFLFEELSVELMYD